jgi:hypothetical protein
VAFCADVLGELQLHQFLRRHPHTLTQKISLLHTSLRQYLGECHSQVVGHRCRFLSSGLDNRDENHPMAVCVNSLSIYTRPGTLPRSRTDRTSTG